MGSPAGPVANGNLPKPGVHERDKAMNFGLHRHQLGESDREPHGLIAKQWPHPFVAGSRRIALIEDEIENLKH